MIIKSTVPTSRLGYVTLLSQMEMVPNSNRGEGRQTHNFNDSDKRLV